MCEKGEKSKRKIEYRPNDTEVCKWKSGWLHIGLWYPRHHIGRCTERSREQDDPGDLMMREGILHDFSHPFPCSFSIIVLVSVGFNEWDDESEWEEEETELHIERSSETHDSEESSEEARECLRSSSDRLHSPRDFLVFIDFSWLDERIIEERSVVSREEARTQSEYEFCQEKSPEPRSETIDTESEDTKNRPENHRSLASIDIREVSCRDLEQYQRKRENRLDHENVLHRESIFLIENRDNRHNHEKISDRSMEIEFPDVWGDTIYRHAVSISMNDFWQKSFRKLTWEIINDTIKLMISSSKKTAIILSWWGMRCSYTWGFLCWLAQKFPSKKPDIIIATSGWAGCATYYLTDQYDEIYNIWTNQLANTGFINPYKIYRVMSIDFVINTVLRKNKPLFIDRFLQTKTNWYITASEIPRNTPAYFSRGDIVSWEDIFDIIEASMSVPVLYGWVKSFYGKKYIDGWVAAPFSATIEKAILLWATEILAIDTSRAQDQNISSLQRKWLSIHLVRNMEIPAKLLTHNPKILEETFMMGYNDALVNNSLEDFFD